MYILRPKHSICNLFSLSINLPIIASINQFIVLSGKCQNEKHLSQSTKLQDKVENGNVFWKTTQTIDHLAITKSDYFFVAQLIDEALISICIMIVCLANFPENQSSFGPSGVHRFACFWLIQWIYTWQIKLFHYIEADKAHDTQQLWCLKGQIQLET